MSITAPSSWPDRRPVARAARMAHASSFSFRLRWPPNRSLSLCLPSDPMPAKPTILIVEDEARMRRLLELDLGEAGFQTLSASEAEKGLELLRREHVDLVLTDLKLPGMTGLEFLHSAKR